MEDAGLLHVPMLRTLPADRVERMARELPLRTASSGQVLLRAGEAATHLVIAQSGSVSAIQETASGTRVRLAVLTAPCAFDKAVALHGAVHAATWTASTACTFRRLPAEQFREMLREEPGFRDHVLGYLAAEVSAQRRSRHRRAAADPVAQVADRLLEMQETVGRSIVLSAGQQGLGEELGLSRVTVNRALSTLVTRGAVRVEVRRVVVCDDVALAAASSLGREGPGRGA